MSKIAAAANLDGRLEIFVCDSHGTLFHLWQTAPNNGWAGGWATLGSGSQTAHVSAARNQDGRLEVFAIDFSGNIVHLWQASPGGPWGNWNILPPLVSPPPPPPPPPPPGSLR